MAALEQSSRQGSVLFSVVTIFHCDCEQNDMFIHRIDSFLTELISTVIIVLQSPLTKYK